MASTASSSSWTTTATATGNITPDTTTTTTRKRPLAKRSCLKCREKKARCELPDVHVPSEKVPVSKDKRCHRCDVLDLDCIVWDGDRKRKPRLPLSSSSSPSGVSQVDSDTKVPGSSSRSKPSRTKRYVTSSASAGVDTFELDRSCLDSSSSDSGVDGSQGSTTTAVHGDQLCEADINAAENLLQNRRKGWRSLWRPLVVLFDRLQRDHRYARYLAHRIEAPPGSPNLLDLFDQALCQKWDCDLQHYLVWHPYLPSLSSLYQQQLEKPARPRAFLMATMALLACRHSANPDSALVHQLSHTIDQWGTQMILASPRDVHMIAAFDLLIAHEPGLVGTAASANDPESRGSGLASENLLICALRIGRELGLDHLTQSEDASLDVNHFPRLARISLWTSLSIWEAHYAFLGAKSNILDHLDEERISSTSALLSNVDDSGRPIERPPRLSDPLSGSIEVFKSLREFNTNLEQRLGKEGILRSAGRTLLFSRLKALGIFHQGLVRLRSIVIAPENSIEAKREKIVEMGMSVLGHLYQHRNDSEEALSTFASQRSVRLCEQFTKIENCFIGNLFSNFCTTSIFNGNLDRKIDASTFVRAIRERGSVAEQISTIGRRGHEMSREVLARFAQLDRQPSRRQYRKTQTQWDFANYGRIIPNLLASAIIVDASKTFLEGAAFVLVAFKMIPSELESSLTLIEAAKNRVQFICSSSSSSLLDPDLQDGMINIVGAATEAVEEMLETMQLWRLYYSVYRPVPTYLQKESKGNKTMPDDVDARPTETQKGGVMGSSSSSGDQTSNPLHGNAKMGGLESLVTAAEAVSSSTNTRVERSEPKEATDPAAADSIAWGWDLNTSGGSGDQGENVTPEDAAAVGIYDLCVPPFDLEAFLRDVDQLF